MDAKINGHVASSWLTMTAACKCYNNYFCSDGSDSVKKSSKSLGRFSALFIKALSDFPQSTITLKSPQVLRQFINFESLIFYLA